MSVEKLPSGRWRARVEMGFKDGKRKHHDKAFDTKKEAQAYERGCRSKQDMGQFAPPAKQTLGTYFDTWHRDVCSLDVRPRTVTQYKAFFDRYVRPRLGDLRLDALKSEDIEALYAHLTNERKLGPGAVRYTHAVLRKCLAHALKNDKIHKNPAVGVKCPPLEKKERNVVSAEQVKRFLDAAAQDSYGAALLVSLFSGMRPGELQGLKREDFNFETCEVTVARTVEWLGNKAEKLWRFGEGKTHCAQRTIPLPEKIMEHVKRHLEALDLQKAFAGDSYQDSGCVFPRGNGQPFCGKTLAWHLKRVLQAAGIDQHMRLYDLRHSMATVLFQKGAPIKVVSERMGHSSTKITQDTYTKVMPGMQKAASDLLADLLSDD